ncbi:glycoside hydrolase family 3 N-terminal domain-containing protein [Nonomuraea sp. CA-143628]|uniref:glycoside hydrolase family 3 N-terminal domain-containing protein n=1 Tax=Nonomuraea sp. CA-143628 TaxID=3239997 RepID=UPI003D9142F4
MTDLPYRDPSLPAGERVADLLSRMTVEEKAGQLTQYFYFSMAVTPPGVDIASLPSEQQAYLELPKMVEDAIRAGRAGSALFAKDAETTNRLQRIAVEESRLGIPMIFGFDVIHGLRTIFPTPIAMAASWSPELLEQAQSVAAREARSVGIHWTFAPMVDIARDPRWGRIVEGAGEDPTLGAAAAAAQVRGFQGDLGPDRVVAGPKHFLGYGAARGGRDYDDAEVSDNELWNVYLPPFQAAIEAGAKNVMSAYMDLNGLPASGNRALLTDILRDRLGFDGFVVSDANAVRSMVTQHFARDLTDASVHAINAGLDMEMCTTDPAFNRLPHAVAEGLVSEDALDAAVARVLTAKFDLGLFETPFADPASADAALAAPEHRELARQVAEQTIVLLKNNAGTLPLAADSISNIAVIGQLADSRRDTLGPWVFDYDLEETITVLDGIRRRVGADVQVEHAPGAGIMERRFPSMFDQMDVVVERTPDDHDDDLEIEHAVALATAADVAIVVAGQRQNQIGEKSSVSTLDLPGRQVEQLRRIAATGTPVVLVLMTGRPVDLRIADTSALAILQAWHPGTRGGEAVASILFGDTSPAARLPFTWPRHVGQVPMIYAHNRTFAPEDQGTRYFDEESTPLYPFGHGLSYAEFEYSNLRIDRPSITVGETALVTVEVTNTSDRDADEVVQLYTHQRHGRSTRPTRELKGFQRVPLAGGQTRTVTFELGPDELRYWSAADGETVQDPTIVDVWVGGSSAAELSSTLEVGP